MAEDSGMIRVGGHGTSGAAGKLWRIAVRRAPGAIGSASHAEAALYYWSDSDPGYYRPGPTVPQPRQKARHRQAKKIRAPENESGKPQGPLIIAISIDRQNLRIYDAKGFFAETAISTGMPGHPTPMGVFSVIQKHKLHHSNIYSGAPMPYMQRITWSGVAMHAGVLPGYPASHGCIRMPMSFAVKMWNWTKMGARVFVTPGEIMTPVKISHPLFATMKIVPHPVAADEPPADKPLAVKADKGAPEAKPANSEASLELRSSVGHIDAVKPVATEATDSTSPRDQTHTADASRDTSVPKGPATMSDASAGNKAPPRDEVAAKREKTVAVDNKPAEAKPAETTTSETKAAETAVADTAAKKPEEAAVASTVTNDTPKVEAKPDPQAAAGVKPEEKAEQKAEEEPAETKMQE